jgi:phosphoribosyl-ATP pyrophosphohydrolase/phosphoribosyl-AMP cyclohydrolase
MLGYMNEAALAQTKESGFVTFYSRSKQRLWTKGEASGNRLRLVSVTEDCDADAVLVLAEPSGPTCHNGTTSCFAASPLPAFAQFHATEQTVAQRLRERPEGSYVAHLASQGLDRMAQKVGEEAVETVIAAKNEDRTILVSEAADLVFHLTVLLQARGCSLADVAQELGRRERR